MFKHWREAEKRAAEILTELEALKSDITSNETEARNEDLAVEKRSDLIVAIQGKVTKRDGLQGEYDKAIEARDFLKEEETRQFGLLSNVSAERVMERAGRRDQSVFETREYELAWAKYIRTGNDTEVRGLISTQNTESAGILVPTTLVNRIEDTMRTGGRLVSLCSTTTIKGITVYPVAGTRTDPAWHEEMGTEKKKQKDITFTSVSMEPQFIAEILQTTRKFEYDSISAFWDWLNMELPDALRRKMDREILWGPQSGKNGIRGILTNTEDKFVAALDNHVLGFNTANTAVSYLADGAEENVTAVMNRRTFFQNVMGLTGTDGHPIFQVMTTNLNRPVYSMGGYPVVFTDELPAYDVTPVGQPYMVMGNFNAMLLNFPNGMNFNLIRDELTRKDDNIIEYLSEVYVAGNITRLGSLVKVKK